MTRTEFGLKLGGGERGSATDRAVVISERDPVGFRRKFAEAARGNGPVFLANPDWGERECREFDALVVQQPREWESERGWLMVPTGGTSGGVKLARHDQHTVASAVEGFCQHFGVSEVNVLGLLPLHHVGGFMGWMRAALTGGHYRDGDLSLIHI